jgi:hypothetical protein
MKKKEAVWTRDPGYLGAVPRALACLSVSPMVGLCDSVQKSERVCPQVGSGRDFRLRFPPQISPHVVASHDHFLWVHFIPKLGILILEYAGQASGEIEIQETGISIVLI